MAYTYKTFRGNMHKKSTYEFLSGHGDFFPLSIVPVILNGKCDSSFENAFYAVVADGNPVCIFSKIFNDRLRTMEWLFTVRNPFLVIAGVKQFLESIMIFVWLCRTMELKLFFSPKPF